MDASPAGTLTMIRFEIEGPIRGYVHGGFLKFNRAKAKRYREYNAWRDLVRTVANTAGVPGELNKDDAWEIVLSIHWIKRAKIDGDGVLKGVLDALWKSDRRVLFGRYSALEHMGAERVLVGIQKVSEGMERR